MGEDTFKVSIEASSQSGWKSIVGKNGVTLGMSTFGKRKTKSADWFEEHCNFLLPLIEKKREALVSHKNNPSIHNLKNLREARKIMQQAARHCANNY